MPRTNVLLCALALTIGCDEGSDTAEDTEEPTGHTTEAHLTAAPDLADLTDDGGCSDVILTRYAADGGLSLVLSLHDGLAADAVATGAQQSAAVDLSAEGSLVLRAGSSVTWLECTDTFDDSQVIETEWTAVSGSVALTVAPQEGSDMPALGTVTITDAVLSADGAEDVAISSMSWSAGVGWVAGG